MPGLLRGVARTAVIAGTATAVSNRVSRRQAGRWAEQEQAQADQQQRAYDEQQAYQQAAPDDASVRIAQLKELASLRDQGILSQAEFEAQKSRLLGT
jgi:hypothetical protein